MSSPRCTQIVCQLKVHICEGSEIAPSLKTLNNYNRFCEKVMSSLDHGPDLAEESGGWMSGKTRMIFQFVEKRTYYSKIAITKMSPEL